MSGVSTDIYGLGLVNESSEGFDQEEYNRLKHAIEEEGEFPQEPPEVKYVKVYRDRYPLVVLRSGRSGDNSSRKGLYEKIVERMIDLAEAYHWVTGWYSFLCKATAGECLLLLEDFQEFMKLVEPNKQDLLLATSGNFRKVDVDFPVVSLRCSLRYRWDEPPDAHDIARIAECRLTQFTVDHFGEYLPILDDVIEDRAETNGPWLDRMVKILLNRKPSEYPTTYQAGWSRGSFRRPSSASWDDRGPLSGPTIDDYFPFWKVHELNEEIWDANREAENLLRDLKGVPRVGKGHVGETKLFNFIRDAFRETVVEHHGSPSWLGNQHLDIWLPDWKIAVEYHGTQHFEPIDHFGGDEALRRRKELDRQKERNCLNQGVDLIITTPDQDEEEVKAAIERLRRGDKQTPSIIRLYE